MPGSSWKPTWSRLLPGRACSSITEHETAARAYPLGDGLAQLRLESPVVAMRGDHVIIRQVAPPDTIGGGIVIDPAARRHGPSDQIVARLQAIEAGRDPGDGADARGSGDAAASAARAVDPAGRERADALGALLRSDGEQPRTDAELADAAGIAAADAAAAFRVLEADGSAVRVARNLHFDRAALEGLAARVIAICERDGSATIAGVRDELGTSRKYAQALLEHLDATKVTLRRDDLHVLRGR